MKSKKIKGFTLIELIAVLVILAILALIVTPLVMNIIRKARISADKRSVDAYGRSVELAIATYLLDTGTFPTSVEQLTIEYSGNKVECSTAQINKDSSVYLAGCTVAGRNVENYTYGSDKSPTYKAYSVGDQVTYNNVDYYVIKDSGAKESTVTLLKAEPLSVEEVNTYGGVGTENNHVNMYVDSDTSLPYYQKALDVNGYGGIAYYSSPTCGINPETGKWTDTGCTIDYAQSDIKYVVDAWKAAKAPEASEARLITIDDLVDNLGYEYDGTVWQPSSTNTPSWVYDAEYVYWTSTQWSNSFKDVWVVLSYNSTTLGDIRQGYSRGGFHGDVVRPIITISKSSI